MTYCIPTTEFNKVFGSRNSQTVELTWPHFNAVPGSAVTLRYENTHTPFMWKQLLSLSQIPTNNKLQVQGCVVFFSLDNLLKQICFLICCDKCSSFISALLHPGLLAFGTPLGAALRLCFWFHSGEGGAGVIVGRCAFTWPSVSTCSESSSSSSSISGSTARAQAGITARVLTFLSEESLCPPAPSLLHCEARGEGCKASSHSSGSGRVKTKTLVNHPGRWNTVNDRQDSTEVWQGSFCAWLCLYMEERVSTSVVHCNKMRCWQKERFDCLVTKHWSPRIGLHNQ